jgi:hypothetical protein
MAAMLAFGRGSSAAICASTFPTSPSCQLLQIRHPHTVLGQRAGLVGADHVDAGQALDRGQPVGKALAPAEPNHAHRERNRRHQNQALGTIGTSAPTIRSTDSRQPASVVNSWV